MRLAPLAFVTLLVTALLAACGGEEKVAAATPPTKAEVVALLRKLEAAAADGDARAALACMYAPAGADEAQGMKMVLGFLKREGLTKAAIDIVEARGERGTLEGVFGDRGKAWAKRGGLDVAQCSALKIEPAEIVVTWGDGTLRILRLDDLGKIKP